MLRNLAATSVVLAIAATSFGQAITVETVDAGDPSIAVVDISTAIDSGDWWTAGGILVQTFNGVTLRYASDPNSETGFALTAPEAVDPGAGRFVSFVSLPRGQDQSSRYDADGAAVVPGLFDLSAGDPMASSEQLNASWLEVPPNPANLSGYIARIGLDLPDSLRAGIVFDEGIKLARVDVVAPTWKHSIPGLETTSFTIFAVPEPSALALLALGALAMPRCRRRRRRCVRGSHFTVESPISSAQESGGSPTPADASRRGNFVAR